MKKQCYYIVMCAAVALLSACAGTGSRLKPGVATLPEIISEMGEPAMRWQDSGGQEQLAYPHGPVGVHTYMVFVGADGRLQRIEQVLDEAHFARIQIGKSTKEEVLRLIGPSYPVWTVEYKPLNQIVWEWNFNDRTNQVSRLDVYFDMTTGVVRNTQQRTVDSMFPRYR